MAGTVPPHPLNQSGTLSILESESVVGILERHRVHAQPQSLHAIKEGKGLGLVQPLIQIRRKIGIPSSQGGLDVITAVATGLTAGALPQLPQDRGHGVAALPQADIQAEGHRSTEAVVADLAVPRGWRRLVKLDPRLTGTGRQRLDRTAG